MIKITFEISEDFIRENAKSEVSFEKMKNADARQAMKIMFDMIGFNELKKQLDEGKTEFVVTPDKVDMKYMDLYNSDIGDICHLAVSSEKNKKEENKDE